MIGQRLFSALSILVGVAGFCAIPYFVGLNDLLWTVGQIGLAFVVLFIVNAACTLLIPAVGWWVLMRAERMPVSLGHAVQANLMGFPLNLLTPSMFLGGEPLKVLYIAKVTHENRQRVLATIIVAKFQELGGLMLGMVVATGLFIQHADYFSRPHQGLLIGALTILSGLFGMTFYAFAAHVRPFVRLLTVVARFRVYPHKMRRLRELVEEVEGYIHTAFTHRVRSFVVAQLITCFSAVSVFLRAWIFFLALPHAEIKFEQLCAFFVLTNLVNAMTIVPGALGLFEAAMTGYASAVGLGDDKGAAFALLSRIADITLCSVGVWCIAHQGFGAILRGKGKDAGQADRMAVRSACSAGPHPEDS